MDLDATLDAVAAAPFEPEPLRALLTDPVVDALIDAARAGEDDEDRHGLLVEALERASWLFAEDERRGARPAVVKKGKVVTPMGPGPHHPRWEDVVVAAVTLRASRAASDGMDQSALNVAVRGLKRFPASEALATLGRGIFVAYGERTGEALSLDEAYFAFSPQEPPSPLAAELRAALAAHAEAEGWAS